MEAVSRTVVAGIDAAPGYWAVCILRGSGDGDGWFLPDSGELHAAPSIREAATRCRDAGARRVLIDMPIGLPDAGSRVADQQARAALGPRRSSVFPTPPRSTLGASNYAEARELSRASTGKAISVQAWNLIPRIREVDEFLQDPDSSALRPEEAHPELGFAALAGHQVVAGSALAAAVSVEPGDSGLALRPLRAAKQRQQGLVARATLLPETVLRFLLNSPESEVLPLPDRMDAAVLAIVAGCVGNAFGDPAARDSKGLPMLIRYALPVTPQST